MILTDQEIEKAKQEIINIRDGISHRHNDCVRIAYEWLNAQKKRKSISMSYGSHIKGMIKMWAKRFVGIDDVLVAAHLHPEIIICIRCANPRFNLSLKYTIPSYDRLYGIGEANKHNYTERIEQHYSYIEQSIGVREKLTTYT